jgi:hypothetical protein
VREGFELFFVAVFTGLAAYIVFRLVKFEFRRVDRRRLRRVVETEPTTRGYDKSTDQECFDESIQSSALLEFRD